MDDSRDGLLCYCLRRRKSEVIAAWQKHQWRDIEEFMDATRVGTVCTSCRSTLRHLLLEEIPRLPRESAGFGESALPKIAARGVRPLGYWKRFRRALRGVRKRYAGPREVSYHAVWRLDHGFETEVAVANVVNTMFPSAVVDLKCRIRCYDTDGSLLGEGVFDLRRGSVRNIGLSSFLGGKSPHEGFGLIIITVAPMRRRDLRRWKTGANRPYLTLKKDGNMMTVHEKALWFDTPRVVPGIEGSKYQDVTFAMANIEAGEGMVSVRLRFEGGEREDKIHLAPYAACLYALPSEVNGCRVEEVELFSTVHISGYQFATNRVSGLSSVQHLVKEGN